jgi:hypothetical protein
MLGDAYVPSGRADGPFSKRVFTTMSDHNKVTIFGPDDMGMMIVDFKTAKGQRLTISVPRGETAVLKRFQALMPYGLVVQDADWRPNQLVCGEDHNTPNEEQKDRDC